MNPWAVQRAELVADLATTLRLDAGLTRILGTTAPASTSPEPFVAENASLVADLSTTLHLSECLATIRDDQGEYAGLLADLAAAIDAPRGLADIIAPAVGDAAVVVTPSAGTDDERDSPDDEADGLSRILEAQDHHRILLRTAHPHRYLESARHELQDIRDYLMQARVHPLRTDPALAAVSDLLRKHRAILNHAAATLAQALPPTGGLAERLQSGIPVAVWHREQAETGQAEPEEDEPSTETQAAGGIRLLWDDFDDRQRRPDDARREFAEMLNGLYLRAGRPLLRELSGAVSIAKSTLSELLNGKTIGPWVTVEAVARQLIAMADEDEDAQATVDRLRSLWTAAKSQKQPTESSAIVVTEQTFQVQVLERSMVQPVVVLFQAEWAAPARQLLQLLERLAAESDRWTLASIDTDAQPRLAQIMRVQSIPVVFAIVDGQPVHGFTGLLPEPQLKDWINAVLRSSKSTVESPRDVNRDVLGEVEYVLRRSVDQLSGIRDQLATTTTTTMTEPARDQAREATDQLIRTVEELTEALSDFRGADLRNADPAIPLEDLDGVRWSDTTADEGATKWPPVVAVQIAAHSVPDAEPGVFVVRFGAPVSAGH